MKKYVAVLALIVSTFILTAEADESFCTMLDATAKDYASLPAEERAIVRSRADAVWLSLELSSPEQVRWSWITLVLKRVDEDRPFGVRGVITACMQEYSK